jgi:hypothetical protein
MLWIVLAALGIPLWVIVGLLLGATLSRRAFKRAPGVFPAKLRAGPEAVDPVDRKWPRQRSYVVWVHDVLLVHAGVALVRNHALPVAALVGTCSRLQPGQIGGLGNHPLMITMVLDDGAVMQLAAPDEAGDAMVGPFLGATAPSVPHGP